MNLLSRPPSRSAHFAALFVAIAGAASVGCGGRADSAGPVDSTLASAGAGGAPPAPAPAPASEPAAEPAGSVQPGCPAEMPEPGSSCAGYAPWVRCEYDYCFGDKAQFSCNRLSGLWDPRALSCDPPPPLAAGCPASVPVPGSDCESEGLSCDYRSECSGSVMDDNAQCRFGQWLVVFGLSAGCDYFGRPVCPERPIIDATGCAYEGQTCAPVSCAPGTAYLEGHQCLNGMWRAAAFTCSAEVDDTYGG